MRLAGLTLGVLLLAACRPHEPAPVLTTAPAAAPAERCEWEAGDVFETAANVIRAEAKAAQRIARELGHDISLDFLTAVTAMQYVQSRVSPYVYASLPTDQQAFTSPAGPLQTGAGLCGNQVDTFLRLMRRLGIRERAVQIYQIDAAGNNHIVAEVWFGGKWNLFDVTWATFYRRPGAAPDALLSLEELHAESRPEALAVTNHSNVVWEVYRLTSTPRLAYAKARRAQTFYDGAGTVRLTASPATGPVMYRPHLLPNMLGTWKYDPDKQPVQTRWVLAGGRRYARLVVHVASVGCADGTLRASGAAGEFAVGATTKRIEILRSATKARGDVELSIQTAQETCLLVIDAVEAFGE